MNYSEKLTEKAKEIAVNLIDPSIKSVFVGGSASRGIADTYSDLEIIIIWDKETNSRTRNEFLEKIHHTVLTKEFDEGEGKWVKSILIDKLKIDFYFWETRLLESLHKSVIEKSETTIDEELTVSMIIDGTAILGEEYLDQVKSNFAEYPESLMLNSVKQNSFFESWSLRQVLIDRQDFVALGSIVNDTVLKLMRLLFAVNKVYLRSHNFKWLNYQISLIKLKPDNLKKRLDFISTNINQLGIDELDKLLKESFRLIQSRLPDFDFEEELNVLNYIRTSN